MLLLKVLTIALFAVSSAQRYSRFRKNRQPRRRIDRICYDPVGCFDVPHRRSPLARVPESPDAIDTKFFLFRRDIPFSHPQVLRYEDEGFSLGKSSFNPDEPLKVFIHGYTSRWNDKGALEVAHLYLKIYNCNVILVDWEKGARGPQYAIAAANTEVVGKQLGILLQHMVSSGLKPQNIHLVGFSLGAHIAGCASESLKARAHLIGRITGLDAASPLFRHGNMRERSKKLDKEDAILVDAIHTDASPVFTDGFGLLEPIGHVDFFPNGGFEQPGCVDGRASVVKSHLEKTLTREMACSHIRAWQLFTESLRVKAQGLDCEFTAFKCRGGSLAFKRGQCFPHIGLPGSELALDSSYRTDLGRLGEDVKGEGVMYLVTRGERPYCGEQLQSSLHVNENVPVDSDIILQLKFKNESAIFQISSTENAREMSALTTVPYNSLTKIPEVTANLVFLRDENEENNQTVPGLNVNRLTIQDMHGESWRYCGKNMFMQQSSPISVELRRKC